MLNEAKYINLQNGTLPLAIPAESFAAEVLEPRDPVLVEFWAPWIRACQALDSVLLPA